MSKEKDMLSPEARDLLEKNPLQVCERWTLYKLEQWEQEMQEEGFVPCEVSVPGYVFDLESFWNLMAKSYGRCLDWTESDRLLCKVLEHTQRHAGYEYLDWDVTTIRWLIRKVKKRIQRMEEQGISVVDEQMLMLHYLAFGFYWEERRMWQTLGEEKKAKRALKNAKDHSIYVVHHTMREIREEANKQKESEE